MYWEFALAIAAGMLIAKFVAFIATWVFNLINEWIRGY